MRAHVFSNETNKRWILVMLLVLAGIPLLASSFYFLYFPVGYQGGRNPFYDIVILFDRTGWDLIHLWTGLAITLIVFIHALVHWKWISVMAQRCFGSSTCQVGRLNRVARMNIIIDAIAAISFLLAAASGIYLMLTPSGQEAALAPVIVFSSKGWDVIHTWSGVIMFITAFLHLVIHWGWVAQVTKRIGNKKEKILENKIIEGVTHA